MTIRRFPAGRVHRRNGHTDVRLKPLDTPMREARAKIFDLAMQVQDALEKSEAEAGRSPTEVEDKIEEVGQRISRFLGQIVVGEKVDARLVLISLCHNIAMQTAERDEDVLYSLSALLCVLDHGYRHPKDGKKP